MIYTHHKFKLPIKKTITTLAITKEKTNQTETFLNVKFLKELKYLNHRIDGFRVNYVRKLSVSDSDLLLLLAHELLLSRQKKQLSSS